MLRIYSDFQTSLCLLDGNPKINKPKSQPEQVKEGTMLDQAAEGLSEKLELDTSVGRPEHSPDSSSLAFTSQVHGCETGRICPNSEKLDQNSFYRTDPGRLS